MNRRIDWMKVDGIARAMARRVVLGAVLGLMAMGGGMPGPANAEDIAAPASVTAPTPEMAEPPAAVMAPEYLYQIAMHLYRWYLDETDLNPMHTNLSDFVFFVRRFPEQNDAGDDSEWAEIRIPRMNLGVKVKRPDYRIEELGVEVHSDHFRMVNVYRLEDSDRLFPEAGGWREVRVDAAHMMATLIESVQQSEFPDRALTERLHVACRKQLKLDPNGREAGDQVMHIAPMSPVANEIWVYVENENLLLRFSSDSDIEAPALWPHQELDVRVHDVRKNTLVSLDQMPGSNMFMTRDQIGRALFNCVVIGKRLIVVNPDDPEAPAFHREFVH